MKTIKLGIKIGFVAWVALQSFTALRTIEKDIVKILIEKFGDPDGKYTTVPPRTKEEE